jgi:hypothetical protein
MARRLPHIKKKEKSGTPGKSEKKKSQSLTHSLTHSLSSRFYVSSRIRTFDVCN